MLSIENTPSLVGTAGHVMAQKKHIRVERPFRLDGETQAVGAIVEVDAPFANEMVAARKAVIVDPPAPAPAAPPVADAEPAPQRPQRRKKD